MTALAVALPGPVVLAPPARLAGLPPVLAGVLLHRAAARRFRAAGTTLDPAGAPSVLVEGGVYAWTRNPMYLAGAFILAGAAALLGVATPVAALPLYLLAVDAWYLRAEERVLEERFGEAYSRYRARVRRWM